MLSLSNKEQTQIILAANEKKRKQNRSSPLCPKKKHLEGEEKQTGKEVESVEREELNGIEDTFLIAPSEDVIKECVSAFIDRTSNKALCCATCAVCAADGLKTNTRNIPVDDMVNKQLLWPPIAHNSHRLTDGMLLEQAGVTDDKRGQTLTVCAVCEKDIRAGKVPKLALANRMWLGKVPMELQVLTLPECVLVAKCFPAAYVVKLFPKKKGAKTWSSLGCNTGMRGNVSTYCLNVEDIANLVNPMVMPPSPVLLAATIGITIVSPHNLPKRTMPGFLHIKQAQIRDALKWLKNNNPLWANIIISDDMLVLHSEEDCVPEEIKVMTKYSDNLEDVDRERSGYVVDDDDDDRDDDAENMVPGLRGEKSSFN